MTHPWEDPNLMPLYHVQVESRHFVMSYEIATTEYDACEVALKHFWDHLAAVLGHSRLDREEVWASQAGRIGYHPVGPAVVVDYQEPHPLFV
jgi:hypothetical protein